ncbi:MAG: YhbY family RNA-binding protein [Candidatus Nanoarchaeia archaeon]|nr:YhbY family RNA-binding protein [Candidatus Nanoarchaeia archaeon]
MLRQLAMQLGKNGITENFIETLKNNFKSHNNVRISVLKSAGHERSKIKEMGEGIAGKLGENYTAKIIGFTIIIRKWRKPVR